MSNSSGVSKKIHKELKSFIFIQLNMSSVIKFKKQLPEIKVIEKFSPNITSFESKEEFIEYLSDHKDEMDKLTTQKLNKMFNIKGYRITKLNGEISLRSVTKEIESNNVTPENNSRLFELKSEYDEVKRDIIEMKKEIDGIKESLVNLVNKLVEIKIFA